jgi:hypothetical protein
VSRSLLTSGANATLPGATATAGHHPAKAASGEGSGDTDFALLINGVKIFARGANLVPFGLLESTVDHAYIKRTRLSFLVAYAALHIILLFFCGGTFPIQVRLSDNQKHTARLQHLQPQHRSGSRNNGLCCSRRVARAVLLTLLIVALSLLIMALPLLIVALSLLIVALSLLIVALSLLFVPLAPSSHGEIFLLSTEL